MKSHSINQTLWLSTGIAFTIAIGWFTMMDGMFFDGIAYATVANNQANGIGSFWHLVYIPTLKAEYYDQPPFVFFFQSFFFRLFGDAVWVERVYSLLMSVSNALLIRAIWNVAIPAHRRLSWFPVLLWLCFPIVTWSSHHNLVENTMSVFDLLAVYCMLVGLQRNKMYWYLAGGAFIFLASFCKGIQGLFPLIVPLVYWLSIERIALFRLIKAQTLVLLVPVVIYVVFYFWNEACIFYSTYIQNRLARTFEGNQDTTNSRLFLLWKLLSDFIIPLCIMAFVFLFPKKQTFAPQWKWFLFFGLIGLSASLPLMITLEQRPFYLATAMPYFALALGAAFSDLIQRRVDKWSAEHIQPAWINRTLKGMLLLSVLSLPFFHTMAKRDHAMLHDLHQLKHVLTRDQVIQVPLSLEYDWARHAYYKRYLGVDLDANGVHPYFMTTKNAMDMPSDPCYVLVPLQTKMIDLYHCQ